MAHRSTWIDAWRDSSMVPHRHGSSRRETFTHHVTTTLQSLQVAKKRSTLDISANTVKDTASCQAKVTVICPNEKCKLHLGKSRSIWSVRGKSKWMDAYVYVNSTRWQRLIQHLILLKWYVSTAGRLILYSKYRKYEVWTSRPSAHFKYSKTKTHPELREQGIPARTKIQC